jgi:hypothetical protein
MSVRRLAACALLLASANLVGCRSGTVAVSFHPKVGTTYRYEVQVTSVSTTTIEGTPPDRRHETVHLVAEHTVLAAGPNGVRVRVVVGEPGAAPQAFVVRFDRAAQLQSIDSVEGAPADIVGALGVPEIFPGAAGAAPRRLSPGQRWTVDRDVRIPGTGSPSRLHSEGRLVELGLASGEKVAHLRSTATLPLRTTTSSAGGGSLRIDGRQHIVQRATYDLGDGAVRAAAATTTGHFRLQVRPPPGTVAPPVPGTLDVRVTSTTKRVEL